MNCGVETESNTIIWTSGLEGGSEASGLTLQNKIVDLKVELKLEIIHFNGIGIDWNQARRHKKFSGGHNRFRGGTPLIFCRTQGLAAKLQMNFPNFGTGACPPP